MREEPAPAPDDLLIRPARGDLRIEPRQHMQVVVHHRKSCNRDREDFRKFAQSVIDPNLAVALTLAQ
ncbi:MAG: hypothetical protein ACLQVF_38200 [Isosphaeraceae bacterium]